MSYYFFQQFSRNLCLVILFILLFLIQMLFIAYNTRVCSNSSNDVLPLKFFNNPNNTKQKFINCIKKVADVYYTENYRFFMELDICIKTFLYIDFKNLDTFPNGASGERKIFLPMSSNFLQQECRWLTIGVGGLILAEELAHLKYPNCKIYGVEPIEHGNFTRIGKLLTVRVGLEDGKSDDGIETLTLPRILDEFVHSRLVHYLSIDIESYEMIILRELIKDGKFANKNITFCQIDAELHNPKQGGQHPAAENINRVQLILDFLDESSPYLPMFTVSYTPPTKITLVNVVNPECEKAFNIKSYFK